MANNGAKGSPPSDPGCPPGWKEVPLTSVADIRFSGVDKVSRSGETPVRLCNYIDVYDNDYITAGMNFMRATATCAEIERFGLQIGDVIITKDSETPDDIGVPAVVDSAAPDLICGYHLAMIRPIAGEIDPTFLAKQLGHHRLLRYFGQQANGSTRYGLSTAAIANAPLRLPKQLRTQQASGAIMRLLDAAIAKTEAVIAKLKQVRAGLVHDLLTRGLDHNGELRNPIKHPEQFKDSPLGKSPSEWETTHLGAISVIQTGDKDTQDKFGDGLYPFYVRSDVIERINSFSFDGEAILTAGDGVGVGKVVHYASGKFDFHQRVYCIHSFPTHVSCRFEYFYFKDNFGRRVAKMSAKNSVDSVRMNMISDMIVPCPPFMEQAEIVRVLEDCEINIETFSTELSKLRYLKYGLMSDLLTGRVRVPENINI